MLSLLIVQSHKSIKTWTKTTWDLITKKGIKHKKQSTIIKVNSTHSKSRTWIPMQNRYAQKENCADDFPIYKWFSHSYVWLPEDTWKTAKISLSKHRPSQNPLVNRNVLHQTKKQCLFSIPCYSNTSPLGLPSTVGFSGKITIVHSKNPQVSCLNQRNPSSLQLKSHEISANSDVWRLTKEVLARFLGGNFEKNELDLERSGMTDSMAEVDGSFSDGNSG